MGNVASTDYRSRRVPAGSRWATTGREQRRMTAHARETIEEVQARKLESEGAMALSAAIMEGLVDLSEYRSSLAGEDPATSMMLAEVMATCLRQVKSIQNSLFKPWGL